MRNKLRTKNEGSWGKEWPLISFNRFFSSCSWLCFLAPNFTLWLSNWILSQL